MLYLLLRSASSSKGPGCRKLFLAGYFPKMTTYGAPEPWAEPYWYQGLKSPYYKETHHRFRERVRAFVEKEIMPFIDQVRVAHNMIR